jgi:hypothetical protein
VSKSALFLLIDNLISYYGADKICYFPSYELVMDELRDYRFYAADMLHLSETATAFVQEKFNEALLDTESKEIIKLISRLTKSLSHRPFQENSSSYHDLLSRVHDEAVQLSHLYPNVNFERLLNDVIQKMGS